jgi:glycosyltransferase involved in cell wall biosynthesis
MKIAVIGTVGIPAKYGGFETLVENLTKQLGFKYNFTVYCSKFAYFSRPKYYNNSKLKYVPLKANGIQSTFYDIWSLVHAFSKNDIILILGVSGCIFLPFYKLFYKKKIIVNIDGLEWKREKWGKFAKIFLKFSEKMAVRYSDLVIADNKVIQDYVASEYNKKSELIEYGADHVTFNKIDDNDVNAYPFLKNDYAFKVCRIEPENNIHLILEAFFNFPNLNLVIIGNWENSEYGQKLREKYSKCDNIFLLNPIYNSDKLNKLRSNCLIYIHGHSAGGTNPSLVEALYLGLFTICYDITYNRETTENKTVYFKTAAELIDLLKNEVWKNINIKQDLLELAKKRYTWNIIVSKYENLFNK